MHFYVFGLINFIIKLFNTDQIRIIVYLFLINYMPMKYKFSRNLNEPQYFAKTIILPTSFDINKNFTL